MTVRRFYVVKNKKISKFLCTLSVDCRVIETFNLCTNGITIKPQSTIATTITTINDRQFASFWNSMIDTFLGATKLVNQIISILCMIDSATKKKLCKWPPPAVFFCLFSLSLCLSIYRSLARVYDCYICWQIAQAESEEKRSIETPESCVSICICV